MTRRLGKFRILMYSHDTFGLGHLRRCQTIAHFLVDQFADLEVRIVSGAPVAESFEYKSRVGIIKLPSVTKLPDGSYRSLNKEISLEETLVRRKSVIQRAAESFAPHIFIVDKEPMGLKGEVEDTLAFLKARKTKLVLGLRDVLDAPYLLAREWQCSNTIDKIEHYYDDIWVYGPKDFYDPLSGLVVPAVVRSKMNYVGFLHRSAEARPVLRGDYILVTPGGGADGAGLVTSVLTAYQANPGFRKKTLIVLGPYMQAEQAFHFSATARHMPFVEIVEFDNTMENLLAGANSVIAMGGYNTYCEILSFDKPALIVPRTHPREEQLIRATRASELGLVKMLRPEEAADPRRMMTALEGLLTQSPPSSTTPFLRLDGLPKISRLIESWLGEINSFESGQALEQLGAV
ncbi:hypothetical protein JNB84_22265 [Rhizobium pusense]|uniref:glycosyltransferase family protein n=1 Tax=Agrobacterium pusense TaxID=648995 RepID=UPI001C6F0DDE|nr:glycosyltransferase [Agrobacterium pusense]MBW9080692.1 hypothetical protein [Agrobacterium pusense]